VTIETFLRKRKALYAGEVGLFPDSPIAEEDFAPVPMGAEVRTEMATERNMAMLKFVWALAGMIADNTEFYLDRNDAMDGPLGLKMRAHHCKPVVDQATGEVTLRPMSLKRLSNEAFHRLLRRFVWVTCNQIIPGMDEGPLRAEIEELVRDKRRPGETGNGEQVRETESTARGEVGGEAAEI
jgi:hypothetical protein